MVCRTTVRLHRRLVTCVSIGPLYERVVLEVFDFVVWPGSFVCFAGRGRVVRTKGSVWKLCVTCPVACLAWIQACVDRIAVHAACLARMFPFSSSCSTFASSLGRFLATSMQASSNATCAPPRRRSTRSHSLTHSGTLHLSLTRTQTPRISHTLPGPLTHHLSFTLPQTQGQSPSHTLTFTLAQLPGLVQVAWRDDFLGWTGSKRYVPSHAFFRNGNTQFLRGSVGLGCVSEVDRETDVLHRRSTEEKVGEGGIWKVLFSREKRSMWIWKK